MATAIYISLVILLVLNLNWSVNADYRNPRYAQFGGNSGSQASASASSFGANRGPIGYGNQSYRGPYRNNPRNFGGPGSYGRPGGFGQGGPGIYGRPGPYGNNRPGMGGYGNQLRPSNLARDSGSVNVAKSMSFSRGSGSASSNAEASSRG